MTMTELLDAIGRAIASDPDLELFARENYGRPVLVLNRIDERNPPGQEDYPLIHLYPLSRAGEHRVGDDEYTVGFSLGLHDDDPLSPDYLAGNYQVYPAVARLDTMTGLVQAAAERGAAALESEPLFLASLSVEYETVEYYPYFLAEMEMQFIRPQEY